MPRGSRKSKNSREEFLDKISGEKIDVCNFDFLKESIFRRKVWARLAFKSMYPQNGDQAVSLEDVGLEKDLRKVYCGETIDVYEPLTWKGSVAINCGAKMKICVGRSFTNDRYEQYTEEGAVLYVLNKKDLGHNYAMWLAYNNAKKDKEDNMSYYLEARLEGTKNDRCSKYYLDIEDHFDNRQNPIVFFTKTCPECFKFFKENKDWFDRLDLSADIKYFEKENDEYKRFSAVKACREGDIDELKWLIQNGIDVNMKDEFGYTLLINAANENIVELLIKAGANIDAKDNFGFTALMHAAKESKKEIVKALLNSKANVNEEDEFGCMALMNTTNSEIAKLLLDAGADANDKDNDNKTVLMAATERGQIDIVKMLVNAGADVRAKDDFGSNVLMFANSIGNEELISYLKKNGAKE